MTLSEQHSGLHHGGSAASPGKRPRKGRRWFLIGIEVPSTAPPRFDGPEFHHTSDGAQPTWGFLSRRGDWALRLVLFHISFLHPELFTFSLSGFLSLVIVSIKVHSRGNTSSYLMSKGPVFCLGMLEPGLSVQGYAGIGMTGSSGSYHTVAATAGMT